MRKNGEVTQDDTTASMIFSFADIIAYTTSFMTLKAGDVVCTGTPVKKTPKVDPPVWLKAGRHDRSRVSRDRRIAQSSGGRGVTTGERAACIIGWPVEHSRSPLIHNYWLKAYGIAGEYRREAVPPGAISRLSCNSLAARGYAGANVTVPHKEAALDMLAAGRSRARRRRRQYAVA